jgi:tetratricopeptide (TPR) repeat protein
MTAVQFRVPAQPAPDSDPPLQRGLAFLRAGQLDEAEFALTAAHAGNPAGFDALHFLAVLRQQQGREREALDLVKRALKLRPRSSESLVLHGMLLSHLADPAAAQAISGATYPRWNGEYVSGTLLVSAAQGLGEQILYASMVPDLVSRADKVVVEVDPRLVDLLARSFPAATMEPVGAVPPAEVAAQASMASLAGRLRPHWDAFPRREHGFLIPDGARARGLRERLANDGRVVIGLSWKSRKNSKRADTARLLDFESLLRLPKCRFIDLQHGDTRAERVLIERQLGINVERLDDLDTTKDVDGLAALMAACDIVVTVSNTAAHLAGAIGRPTWVFAPCEPARPWYWFDNRSDSPWYPHVRLKCQANGQSWADLIASHADEIW